MSSSYNVITPLNLLCLVFSIVFKYCQLPIKASGNGILMVSQINHPCSPVSCSSSELRTPRHKKCNRNRSSETNQDYLFDNNFCQQQTKGKHRMNGDLKELNMWWGKGTGSGGLEITTIDKDE